MSKSPFLGKCKFRKNYFSHRAVLSFFSSYIVIQYWGKCRYIPNNLTMMVYVNLTFAVFRRENKMRRWFLMTIRWDSRQTKEVANIGHMHAIITLRLYFKRRSINFRGWDFQQPREIRKAIRIYNSATRCSAFRNRPLYNYLSRNNNCDSPSIDKSDRGRIEV